MGFVSPLYSSSPGPVSAQAVAVGEPLIAGSLKRLLILARLGRGEIRAEAKYAGAGHIVVAVTQDAALDSLSRL